jgi:hypothetical protein
MRFGAASIFVLEVYAAEYSRSDDVKGGVMVFSAEAKLREIIN